MEKSKIIAIDIETTGLEPGEDEILQVGIIDGYGKVLFSSFVCPEHTLEWEEAAKVNKIGAEKLYDAPVFDEVRGEIEGIIRRAELIVGYNHTSFDIPFLVKGGVNLIGHKAKHYDVMREYAYYAGDWNAKKHYYRWKRLTECAAHYGYFYPAHDAVEDAKATLHCYYAMKRDVTGRIAAVFRKRKERRRNGRSKD